MKYSQVDAHMRQLERTRKQAVANKPRVRVLSNNHLDTPRLERK